MRAIPFLLLATVFAVAIGNYLMASTGTANAPEKPAATSLMTPPAPSTPKDSAAARSEPDRTTGSLPANAGPAGPAAPAVACVHRNDGGTVCGPVVDGAKQPAPSLFDQPVTAQAKPLFPAVKPPHAPAKIKVAERQAAPEAPLTPKQVQTPPLPRHTKRQEAQAPRSDSRQAQVGHGAAPASPPYRKHGNEDLQIPPARYTANLAAPPGVLRQPAYPMSEAGYPPLNQRTRTSMPAGRQGRAGGPDAQRQPPFLFDGQPRPGPANRTRIASYDGGPPMPPNWQRIPRRYGVGRDAPPALERRPAPHVAANHRQPPRSERERSMDPAHDRIRYAYGNPARPDAARDAKLADFDRRAAAIERQIRALRAEQAEALRRFRNSAGSRASAPPPLRDRAAQFD